ncbi:hypothetical protein NQZ68_012340 [Dissostichus eleginoides]|nr:hypothetical protein NQZ68_012340 [Dissostichus eleginoides]
MAENTQISKHPSPPHIPPPLYNSATIPVPAQAATAQKYQHLQEQTQSLSEHHHIPQDSLGRERKSRWKDEHRRCRENRINREERKSKHCL